MSIDGFIAARLDDKERSASGLLETARRVQREIDQPGMLGRYVPGWDSWADIEAAANRMLSEVAAMRKVLAAWSAVILEGDEPASLTDLYDSVCGLSAIWREHPDFDPSWAPETAEAR